MAVPKRRMSKSRRNMRRSHHALVPVQVQYCPRCSEATLPHKVCSNCGWYQGREAVAVEKATEK
ncbi:MAG: 50S ribosomal protein L32 [Gemmataceae bacterium]|nr:50S ribosomal protein L32 [Gemmataceae bacterium]